MAFWWPCGLSPLREGRYKAGLVTRPKRGTLHLLEIGATLCPTRPETDRGIKPGCSPAFCCLAESTIYGVYGEYKPLQVV